MKLLLVLFFFLLPALAGAEEAATYEDLDALVRASLAANPEISASQARWEMYRNRVRQAGAWEDPMLMLKIQNGMLRNPLDFSGDDMTQKVIGISQLIPFRGKLAAKAEVAEKEAEANRFQVEERKLELRRMVKEAYYGIWFVDRSAGIIERNIAILDTFIKLAETRYAVGQGVQQDVLKAQVERSRMLEMQINLRQQRKSLEVALNSLLFRSPDTPVGGVKDPESAVPELKVSVLVAEAQKSRPLLRALEAQIDKAKAAERVARLDYYPDFNVSLEYMQRSGGRDDMYSAGVTFNLPVRKERREAAAAESRSEARMGAAELEAAKNSIRQSIGDLSAQIERRGKLVELYGQGLIPQARQALESALIAYEVGKVDFMNLLDSRVALYNYEREYYDSIADMQMKRAQLEAVVGK